MPDLYYAYDPVSVFREQALAKARSLGVPNVVRGLAPWMIERGITYGRNGTVIVALSSVPWRNAARQVLAVLKDADITQAKINAIVDFPMDTPPLPPTNDELQAQLDALAAQLTALAARVTALEQEGLP